MLHRLFAIPLALAFVPASAHAAERNYLVGSFQDLIVQGDIIVTLTTGIAPSAKASGDKDRLASLKIDRQGQVVRIRLEGLAANRTGGEPLRVMLSGRDVRKLIVQGNGRVTANVLDTAQTRLEIRGSGEIQVGRVKGDSLVALLVGSGKLSVGGGSVRSGDITIDGAPIIDASGIAMDKLRLMQNGPASTHFLVNTSAEITNSGTGTIAIDGAATCLIRQAGGATIACGRKQ